VKHQSSNSLDWKQQLQTVVPLLLAFLVTRQMRLRSWRSLLVYMLVANVVRQILEWGELAQFSGIPLLQSTEDETVTGNGKLIEQKTSLTSILLENGLSYKVIHATPGRVRIRFPKISEDGNFAAWLESMIIRHPKVTGVRMNRATGSITITYDATQTTLSDLDAALSALLTKQLGTPFLSEHATNF
jgi:Heavy metal associated domain 2